MSDDKTYAVPADWQKRAFVDDAKYREMYTRSIKDPNGFWGEHAKRVDWIKPFTKVKNTSYDPHNVSIKWFEDGTLNACYNCVDRHVSKRGDQTALIWEGDDPKDSTTVTCPSAPNKRRSSGKVTIPPNPKPSPTKNCIARSAALPMC